MLEYWRISGLVEPDLPGPEGSDSILTIASIEHPVLEPGNHYWVMISVPEPNSDIAWWVRSSEYTGVALQAERNSSLDFLWRVAEWTDGAGGLSLRVMATAT